LAKICDEAVLRCCAAQQSVVETGQPLRDAYRNRPEGHNATAALQKLSSNGCAHRLAVLSVHVRADAITQAAVRAVAAADAAPATDAGGDFLHP